MGPTVMKVLWFLLLIGPLITIHELGHFLVAKAFKVKVLRFSIGFGPRLLGFTYGETEYQIAALPLGGYVKMAGDDPSEPSRPADRRRGFLDQPPWKRSLIALAGPFTNLAFPVLIYFCVNYFQVVAPSTRVGDVDPDFPAYAAGLRDGDRIAAIDGTPVHYFDDLRDLIAPKWDKPIHIDVERPDGTRFTTTATPRKVMVPGILHDAPKGLLGISARQRAAVVAVAGPGSAAGRAGLQSLDRITQVGDQPVALFKDLERAFAQQKGPLAVSYLRAAPLGTPGAATGTLVLHHTTLTPVAGADLEARTGLAEATTVITQVAPGSPAARAGLRRGDWVRTAGGKPLSSWSTLERLRLQAKLTPIDLGVLRGGALIHVPVTQTNITQQNERGKDQTVLYFGALPDQTDEPAELIAIHKGVWGSLSEALQVVPQVTSTVVQAVVGLLTNQVSPKTMGGPVMLFDIASKTAQAGWDVFLGAMAAISINLGIMNLIPVPVLDGFTILSAGFEWVRRRPLSLRTREIANAVGLVMLLIMMVYVLQNDLVNYVFKK